MTSPHNDPIASDVFLLWEEVSDQTGKKKLIGAYSTEAAAEAQAKKNRRIRTWVVRVPLDTIATNSWGW